MALAPADFAARDRVEILDLLLLGTELQQRGAEPPDTEAVERRARMDALHFLFEELGLLGGEPRTAIGFGPVGPGSSLRHARSGPTFWALVLDPPFRAPSPTP